MIEPKPIKEIFSYIADRMLDVAERVFDRLRPNVIIVALLVTFLIMDFGNKLIDKIPEAVGAEVLALLIGTGIGGLIACMMRMFESPSIPADTFERMMRVRFQEEEDK